MRVLELCAKTLQVSPNPQPLISKNRFITVSFFRTMKSFIWANGVHFPAAHILFLAAMYGSGAHPASCPVTSSPWQRENPPTIEITI
jgi:hypothetical protein